MSTLTDRRKFRKNNPEKLKSIPAQMGDGHGHLAVPDMPGYFYCRVAGRVEIVYNDRVPAQNDLLVDVGRDTVTGSETPGIFKVLSTRTSSPAGAGGLVQVGYAPASRYEWMRQGGGQDPLWVQQRQIMPLRVGPYSGMTVQVWFGVLWTGTVFASIPWQTLDLTAHIPAGAGDAAFVLITIDTDGLVVDTKGDEFVLEDMTTDELMLANIPTAPADTCYICGAVRVYNGQTAVIEGRVNTDIVDLRASANGGAPGGVTDGDKGDITVSSSGTVWRLRAQGAYNESTTAAGVYGGIVSGTPRWMLANGTAAQNWQIDNSGGDIRFFLPGVVRMTLSPTTLTLEDTTILEVQGAGTSLFNGSVEAGGHIEAGGTVTGSNLSGTNTGDETTASIASKSIEDAINNGIVDKAPSENAVFDALALKAPLASPALTGTPTATTAAAGTSTTQIATTAFVTTAFRERLTANRTYYVRTDGSDSNTGLVDSAGGAFLTWQKAIDVTAALDISIYNVDIQIKDGTFTAGVLVSAPWIGSGTVTIKGNSGTPANVLLSVTSLDAIAIKNGGARLTIQDFEIRTTTSGYATRTDDGGKLNVSNIRYGACALEHMSAVAAVIEATGNYTISGNARRHWIAFGTGVIKVQSRTVTLSGTPAFSSSFAEANSGAIYCNTDTFSGSGTGTRYSALNGGVIFTGGGGANYLPGNAAGSAPTGYYT